MPQATAGKLKGGRIIQCQKEKKDTGDDLAVGPKPPWATPRSNEEIPYDSKVCGQASSDHHLPGEVPHDLGFTATEDSPPIAAELVGHAGGTANDVPSHPKHTKNRFFGSSWL